MKRATIAKNVSGTNVSHDSVNKQNKQKVLLPTLKEQQRYVVYKLIFDNTNNNNNNYMKDFGLIHNNILMQCNTMLGIFDGGKAGLISAKYNAGKLSGIIRVSNDYVDKLKLCLGLIKDINYVNSEKILIEKVIVDCIYVSGMLNKAVDKMDA